MKRINILIILCLIWCTSATAFAYDLPKHISISVSAPSNRIIQECETIRYTVSFDAAKDKVIFCPEKIIENFSFDEKEVIQITPYSFDIIYHNVKATNEASIICQKGTATTADGQNYSLATPKSLSFFIALPETTREQVFDFLSETIKDKTYKVLIDEGIIFGYDNGDLGLSDYITSTQIYVLNRRLENRNQ